MPRVRVFATLREATGGEKQFNVEGKTVKEVIKKACEKYGDEFARGLKTSIILVNGINVIELKGARTPLKETDEIAIFPPVAGG